MQCSCHECFRVDNWHIDQTKFLVGWSCLESTHAVGHFVTGKVTECLLTINASWGGMFMRWNAHKIIEVRLWHWPCSADANQWSDNVPASKFVSTQSSFHNTSHIFYPCDPNTHHPCWTDGLSLCLLQPMPTEQFNSSLPGLHGRHFGRRQFQMHLLEWKLKNSDLNFIVPMSNWQ